MYSLNCYEKDLCLGLFTPFLLYKASDRVKNQMLSHTHYVVSKKESFWKINMLQNMYNINV
jgi:hypothetical protein